MTEASPGYAYREGDEERVAAAIAADPGISTTGLSEELGLPLDAIKRLTSMLRTQRRAAFRSLMDEDGDLVVGWYPVPYDRSKAASAPVPEAPQETKNEAVKPDKEARTKCQYCGAEKETNAKRVGHERFCKLNPNRELAPGERKKAKVGPTSSADDVRSPRRVRAGRGVCVQLRDRDGAASGRADPPGTHLRPGGGDGGPGGPARLHRPREHRCL